MNRNPTVSNIILGLVMLVLLVGGIWWIQTRGTSTVTPSTPVSPQPSAVGSSIASNPAVDPGSKLGETKAPLFTLTNQSGQAVSLHQFRGKVVILAFVDSQCTTVCPLTTASMLDAVRDLGPLGHDVQLLGVNANPQAIAVADVQSYTEAHGMSGKWSFLTGSRKQLASVWQAYHIYASIVQGQIDHTPALYIIDPQGRERELYMTQMAYSGISAQGQILANAVQQILQGTSSPTVNVALPAATPVLPRTLQLLSRGNDSAYNSIPGVSAHEITVLGHERLLVFFGTWLSGLGDVRQPFADLSMYQKVALSSHLPAAIAVDEFGTEENTSAVRSWIHQYGVPSNVPVALDVSGEAADALAVQDMPWVTLVSTSGKVLWHHDGWMTEQALLHAVQGRK